jgi:hypothetical protein
VIHVGSSNYLEPKAEWRPEDVEALLDRTFEPLVMLHRPETKTNAARTHCPKCAADLLRRCLEGCSPTTVPEKLKVKKALEQHSPDATPRASARKVAPHCTPPPAVPPPEHPVGVEDDPFLYIYDF